MKTIKIIDLLNKIAKGEEVPKKIKFKNDIYELGTTYNSTYYVEGDTSNDDLLSKRYIDLRWFLNDEVEIIEEDKDITEVLEIELLGQSDNWLQSKTVNIKLDMELNPYILNAITRNFKLLYSKQCELIDEVNRLKGKYE